MSHSIDLLLISPGNNRVIYQDLAQDYAAIEPPIWAGLIANFSRKKGYDAMIIDQEAEGLSSDQIAQRTKDLNPRLVALIVYGQQPSASTQNMTMAAEIATRLKQLLPSLKIVMVGGHPSALPQKSLLESEVDFVCQGEGPLTIDALLKMDSLDDSSRYTNIPGLWYRDHAGNPIFTFDAANISEKDLPTVLPGVAWDLLPMKQYRAHNWHSFSHIHQRKPYASIYTSLGCPYRCTFCCINAPFTAGGKNVPTIRCWDPQFIIKELDILATQYNVKNIKIADEMFVLNESHVMELCDLIIERGYQFNFWAYARVDTVNDHFLEKLKKAGFNWLCLGIESASKHVRSGVQKGRFKEEDIYSTVNKIKAAGIYIIGNYIFGLPDDNYDSMQATFDMALELNCEMANFYSGMAYPGSQLYHLALEKKWEIPKKWHDFSQHSFEQLPLPTEYLSAGEVLSFRDKAWQLYFTNPKYLNLLQQKFGQDVVDHIKKLTTYTLKRKYSAPLKVQPMIKSVA